jgi:hypothetical protein
MGFERKINIISFPSPPPIIFNKNNKNENKNAKNKTIPFKKRNFVGFCLKKIKSIIVVIKPEKKK